VPNKSSKKKNNTSLTNPLNPNQSDQTKAVEDFVEIELSKSMRLVDCSEGKTVLTKYSGVLWNRAK
jgi:hypothetical protein